MPNFINRLTRSGLDLVFPLECLACHAGGRLLCPNCTAHFPRLEPPFCPLCAEPGSGQKCDWCAANQPAIDGIRAPFLMLGTIREAVHRFKYRNLRAAAPELAGLLADYLAGHPMPGQVIVPVPLHRRRLRSRGYNQAKLLAAELSKITGLPMNDGVLTRSVDSMPQVQASNRRERAANVAQSFQCPVSAKGLEVLLVDDVTTTGSTLSACARALKDAGAVSVWGLALAKEA